MQMRDEGILDLWSTTYFCTYSLYSVTDVVELSDVAKDKKVLENIFSAIRCNILHAGNK